MPRLLRHCLPPPADVLPEPPIYWLKIETRMRVRDLVLAIGLVLLWVLSLKAEPICPPVKRRWKNSIKRERPWSRIAAPWNWLEPVNAEPMGK